MTPGKLAAQAGHAFLGALENSKTHTPELAQLYQSDPPGTKIALVAKNLEEILKAKEICELEGIPHSLIVDSGHIMLPHFDGSPIITALGIGPSYRGTIRHVTKKFNLI